MIPNVSQIVILQGKVHVTAHNHVLDIIPNSIKIKEYVIALSHTYHLLKEKKEL